MRVLLGVLGVLIGVGCGSATPAPRTPAPSAPVAVQGEAPRIDNFAQIAPGLFRGAQPSDEGYAWLKARGVRTIVNFRSAHENLDAIRRHGLTQVWLPMRADISSDPPTEQQIEVFFQTVLDPEKQPVFIHCRRGADRTGTMAALYRIEVDGWTNARAVEEMQQYGYAFWYQDLVGAVQDYRPRGYARQLAQH